MNENQKKIKALIIALEKQALEDWNNGNPDRFIELSSDEVVYIDPAFESKLEGKKALENYYDSIRGKIMLDNYQMIDPVVQLFPGIAVLTYHYQVHRNGITFKMNCSEVYKSEESNQWKIVNTHWSFVKPQ